MTRLLIWLMRRIATGRRVDLAVGFDDQVIVGLYLRDGEEGRLIFAVPIQEPEELARALTVAARPQG